MISKDILATLKLVIAAMDELWGAVDVGMEGPDEFYASGLDAEKVVNVFMNLKRTDFLRLEAWIEVQNDH
jgi:hypothetical protein